VRRRSAAAVDLLQGAASAGHLFEGAAPVSLLQLATVSRQGLCSAGMASFAASYYLSISCENQSATGLRLVPVWGFNEYCVRVIRFYSEIAPSDLCVPEIYSWAAYFLPC
jgi:hypothetical protein